MSANKNQRSSKDRAHLANFGVSGIYRRKLNKEELKLIRAGLLKSDRIMDTWRGRCHTRLTPTGKPLPPHLVIKNEEEIKFILEYRDHGRWKRSASRFDKPEEAETHAKIIGAFKFRILRIVEKTKRTASISIVDDDKSLKKRRDLKEAEQLQRKADNEAFAAMIKKMNTP